MKITIGAWETILVCGGFGARYGAWFGAIFGTCLYPILGTLVGLIVGSFCGFVAGVISGSIGGPVGFGIGGLASSLLVALPFPAIREVVPAPGSSMLDLYYWYMFLIWHLLPINLTSFGVWVGAELRKPESRLPRVNYLRDMTNNSVLVYWPAWKRWSLRLAAVVFFLFIAWFSVRRMTWP